jgi:hypothetical protein
MHERFKKCVQNLDEKQEEKNHLEGLSGDDNIKIDPREGGWTGFFFR